MIWPLPDVLAIVLALFVGLILGSFYNVCVHRWLTEESLVRPRSKCPNCGHQLQWWELFPILSYIILRGKCSDCKKPISLRYPLVELISGLWAAALMAKFGPGLTWIFFMVIGGILIVASFIDFQSYLLPEDLTIPGIILAMLGAVFILDISPKDALLGSGLGAGLFWGLQKIYKLYRGHEGMGTGDIMLMFLLGALIGWKGLPIMILASALSALAVSIFYLRRTPEEGMRTMVPFGPFLSLGGMLYILYGDLYWKFMAA